MTDHEFQMIKELDCLKIEHRRLDDTIDGIARSRPDAELEIVRLKKQKLAIKDRIIRLESFIYPDIPA